MDERFDRLERAMLLIYVSDVNDVCKLCHRYM